MADEPRGAGIDLESLERPPPDSLPEPPTLPPPTFVDKARRNIAYWLLAILSGIIAVSFVLLLWALRAGAGSIEANFQHISGLLNIIYGPVVTLVGSAMGFYFGAQTAQSRSGPS